MLELLQLSLLSAAFIIASPTQARQNGHGGLIKVQSSIDSASIQMAGTVLNEAIEYENEGKLALAAGRFEDLLGLDGEALGPYQAIGAIHLCGVLGKMGKIAEAREYCRRASEWPGVPDRIHEAAQRLLNKLPEQ
jgi:hypothetical protein